MADRACLPGLTLDAPVIFALLGLLGPGLIAANAGNDAGGMATYSSVGAKYGYGLLWTIVLITISLAIVQRLAARMGVVTGKGLAELVREEYGIRWSVFATSAVLIANLGICISDFVGVGAALGLAGIPRAAHGADRRRRHLADHRARLLPHRPSGSSSGSRSPSSPTRSRRSSRIRTGAKWARRSPFPTCTPARRSSLLLIALAGTTITPYMQLYLQSAVVERGVREEDLPQRGTRGGRRRGVRQPDRRVHHHRDRRDAVTRTASTTSHSAADAARALTPFAGQYAEVLFGVGLLGASLLAAAILPIATSYVVSESLGYEKGVGRRREEAPVFVNIITAMILLSAFVAMIPGVPVISLLDRRAGRQRAAAPDQPVLHLAPGALRT